MNSPTDNKVAKDKSSHTSNKVSARRYMNKILSDVDNESFPPSNDVQSSRNLIANVKLFLHSDFLGKLVQSFGKAAVMAIANTTIEPSVKPPFPLRTPKFNKYSGVAEWQNSIFLWVNIGDNEDDNDPDNIYVNSFDDAGRAMVWFGGNRMTKGVIRGRDFLITFQMTSHMYMKYRDTRDEAINKDGKLRNAESFMYVEKYFIHDESLHVSDNDSNRRVCDTLRSLTKRAILLLWAVGFTGI
jgi:hypothetical protein